MFVITNRIKTKKGFANHMAPAFTKDSQVQQFQGFIKTEVLVATNDKENYDEMNVNMYWDSLENFKLWRESDAFKNAHKRPSGDSESESPILGSEIVISEIISTTE